MLFLFVPVIIAADMPDTKRIDELNEKIYRINLYIMQNESTMWKLQQENIAYANQIKVLTEYKDELIEKRKQSED